MSERDEAALGRVQRVDGPTAALVALTIYDREQGKRVLVFSAAPEAAELRADRPRGAAADGFVRRLRKLLVGAEVAAVERRGPAWRVRLRLRSGEASLEADEGAPVLRSLPEGKPLAGRRKLRTRAAEPGWEPVELGALAPSERPRLDPAAEGRRALRRDLVAHRKRLKRKLAAIRKDGARAEQAPGLRHEAELITAHLHRWRPGETTLRVLDWGREPAEERELALDPRRTAAEGAERRFARAKRLERGAEIAAEREAKTAAELARVEGLLARVDAGEEALEELREEARTAAVPKRQRPRRGGARGASERKPFRRFLGHGDAAILVGRSAADNDALTLSARPHHLWLHARGVRGTHVIVPLNRGQSCPPELLVDAATLAAHFSEARGEASVEVQHTPRRYVHKRKGAAAGAVTVEREKTLLLQLEPERLAWLLERERD
ncbi:MAG TPA: NFACT RNA binding domain-containing protein [Polyangiaceae bacterium LLY-WYZ-15_(1-7)]|nr:NFACT RNA binding domain-containing protein [Polyangiaceae bacterium LLY-WYZ-15_(1-7)]